MTKVAKTPVQSDSLKEQMEALQNIIGIDKNTRMFVKSVNADKRLIRFLNADFPTPTIFKDNNFKEFVKDSKATLGNLVDAETKKVLLNNIVTSKVEDEVEAKVNEFKRMPLTAAQTTQLEAAASMYKEKLNSIVAKAKVMVTELK